ncbi:DUF3054 domain-containing protein [Microbacterium candidum]|uniref:DUF3054 domain-containing protein n=1 Tax=Microbacterium candidum TaxID=3041922 RepID=A0ABT7MZP4_9MICO|nr:DUF3054 domain-containing protein [Microbacterium sp. ASV49]MDL9979928.1 DUF3054 domain-containing protein [Microbacterium sp. ASV49]
MRHPLRTVLLSFAADAVLVVVFAAIGRASHKEEVLSGLFVTAWPFLVALAVGWLVSLAWRAPLAPVRTGIPVWAVTVAGGMLLRAISGQGVVLAFVIVASVVLFVFLVGWRFAARLLTRRRAGRAAA